MLPARRGACARSSQSAFTSTCSTFSARSCCCCCCSPYERRSVRRRRANRAPAPAGATAERPDQELEGEAPEPARRTHLAAVFRPREVSAQRHGCCCCCCSPYERRSFRRRRANRAPAPAGATAERPDQELEGEAPEPARRTHLELRLPVLD